MTLFRQAVTRGASTSKRQVLATRSFQPKPSNLALSPKMSPPSSRSAQVAGHLSASPSSRSLSTSSSTKAASSSESPEAYRQGLLAQATAAPGLPLPHTGGGPSRDEPKVLFRKNNTAVEIILNRESAINALDLDMVRGIAGAIDKSAHSSQASCIVLRASEGARGLCSGGDVLAVVNMANSAEAATREQALQFFKEEFELDWRIARLGEEVVAEASRSGRSMVAIMDGITMGGGVGLSVHAPFRIATEKTRFAMPETGIGYFPDVGVTRVLSRLDGRVGTYLGMTGDHISGEEAYLAGLATHYVPSTSLAGLVDALSALPAGSAPNTVASCIDDFCTDPFDVDAGHNAKIQQIAAQTPLTGDKRIVLDYVFGQPSVEAVFGALDDLAKPTNEEAQATQAGEELRDVLGVRHITDDIRQWASKTYQTLHLKSPRSLMLTHQAINYEARSLGVDESFRFDMRMATVFCDLGVGRDFYEGVHHVLTKDPSTGKRREGRAPWKPEQVGDVDASQLRDLFFRDLETAKQAGLTLTPPTLNIPENTRSRAAREADAAELRGVGPLGWEAKFNAFHPLPSDAELEALVHGSHPSAGSLAIDVTDPSSVREIAEALRGTRGGRRGQAWGLERKVADWRARRVGSTQQKQQ